MLNTYRAILRNDHLEWTGNVPELIKTGQPVPVNITILDEATVASPIRSQGKRMAEILDGLAAINALASINDPIEWEREVRADRPLPGREP